MHPFTPAVWLLVGALLTPTLGDERPPKATVEIRWLEYEKIDGVTEAKGFQSSCDPKSIVYPHQKPALTLTKKEVASVELHKHDFTKNGLGLQYSVTINLTKDARDKLAASVKGNATRELTIAINGRYWGTFRYEKDKEKPFVPEVARAATFTPNVGFFSKEADAEQLVEALK